MTEQTRIPVPEAPRRQDSLIERLAAGTSLSAAPPPVPGAGKPRPAAPGPDASERAKAGRSTVVRTPTAPAASSQGARRPTAGTGFRIDRSHLRDHCLIEPDGPVSGLLEEFRIIKRQLLLGVADAAADGDRRARRILVVSAHPGEGKTFCAINLALSIAAEKDNEVLLVDADFAKPSVLSTLGLPGGHGLMDALADPRIAVEDCVMSTDIPGLSVLPAGSQTGSDTEYLASSRTAEVLSRLDKLSPNRIVIYDSPPALAASPASVLASHVAQTVLVVRADSTGEAAVRDAIGILSGCPDISLLLNGTRFSPTGRAFGSYYGYKE